MAIQQIGTPAGSSAPVVQPRAKPVPASAPQPTPAPAAAELPPEQVAQALEQVRKTLAPVAQNLQFSIDDDTGRTVVKVIDAQTKEVIRQIPSEELMAITRALSRLQGLLLDREA